MVSDERGSLRVWSGPLGQWQRNVEDPCNSAIVGRQPLGGSVRARLGRVFFL